MSRYRIFIPAIFLIIIISFKISYGDIVETNDGMVLNGKIIEDKKGDYIKFGNYHGTFHIEYRLIKGIHRTNSFKEDIKIFKDKGKTVNESEVMINYQAGVEKLEAQGVVPGEKAKEKDNKKKIVLLVSPFYNFNIGKLSGELPHSFGGSVTGHFAIDQFDSIRKLYLSGVVAEAGYFYSENGGKKVSGPRISAGPLWNISIASGETTSVSCVASPVIGFGWYVIKGRYEDAVELKLNAAFTAGPLFNVSAIVFAPLFRFDYIYDSTEPLYGIGFSIAAGFKF